MATQAIPPRLTDLVLDFLGYLEIERGLSRNTLEAYRSDLQQFEAFLSGRGLSALTLGPAQLASMRRHVSWDDQKLGEIEAIKPGKKSMFFDIVIRPDQDLMKLRDVMVMNK